MMSFLAWFLPSRYVIVGAVVLYVLCMSDLHAQHQYDVWYFGVRAGMSFANGAPTPLLDGETNTLEGTAVLCDRTTGRLLFYTDGVRVWNALHKIMPQGINLKGHKTSAQSALIVPDPGDTLSYYIFTTGAGFYDPAPNNGLRYSKVDLRLNGGTGDVTLKNVELMDTATEQLTATRHCNGRDYWVVSHEYGTNKFRSYLVSATGITGPVVSSAGAVYAKDPLLGRNGQGGLKFSSDGQTLAAANTYMFYAAIFDFDNASGEVSNERILTDDNRFLYYYPAFSPDNSKLYISTLSDPSGYPIGLFQFDLKAGGVQAIKATRYQFPVSNVGRWSGGQIQLGPDGRIYFAIIGRSMLRVIENPNQSAPSCNYEYDGFNLGGRISQAGLPNIIESDLFGAISDTSRVKIVKRVSNPFPEIGDTISYTITLCNFSCMPAIDVVIEDQLPTGLRYLDGFRAYPRHTFNTIPAGGCDSVTINAVVTGSIATNIDIPNCAWITDGAWTTSLIPPDSACASIYIDNPDPGADFVFYLPQLCPGSTRIINVPLRTNGYADTIVGISFIGLHGRNYDLAIGLPLVITPATTMSIPVLCRWTLPGVRKTVMSIRTASGNTYRVLLVADGGSSDSPIFNMTVLRVGNRTGTFDTCIALTNVHDVGIRLTDTAWLSTYGVRLLSPQLPYTVGPLETVQLCLRVSNADANRNDTIILGGLTAVEECAMCMHHLLVIDRVSPNPGPTTSGIEEQPDQLKSLLSIFPNPAGDKFTARFILKQRANVELTLVDERGKFVQTILQTSMESGEHLIGCNLDGVPSGIYFVLLRAEDSAMAERVRVVR